MTAAGNIECDQSRVIPIDINCTNSNKCQYTRNAGNLIIIRGEQGNAGHSNNNISDDYVEIALVLSFHFEQ